MKAEEVTTTVSFNGGPEIGVDLEKVNAAIKGNVRAKEGHNSSNVAADRLRSLVEQIERLNEERKGIGSDIKDIFAEAKGAGFDVKVMRMLLRLRKLDPAEVEEQETLLDVYRRSLGM